MLATPLSSAAQCLEPHGDVDGSGTTTIVDVQCAILGVLWSLAGSSGPIPLCLTNEPFRADLNCDGSVLVDDIQIAIGYVLGLPLPAVTDTNGNGCHDACDALEPGPIDCASFNPAIHSPPPEVCNGFDDDCDGVIDEGGSALCGDGNPCTVNTCQPQAPCTGFVFAGRCYEAKPGMVPWFTAASACEGQGGVLAAASTLDRDEAIRGVAAQVCGSGVAYHIGLSRDLGESSFRWLNGDFYGYTNWQNQPPENISFPLRSSVSSAGKWEWSSPSVGKPCAVCERPDVLAECVVADVDCDDGNLCTADSCEAAPESLCCEASSGPGCTTDVGCESCVCALAPACCTGSWSESCAALAAGSCNAECNCDAPSYACVHALKHCDDGNLCTEDLCQPATGQCQSQPITCDDSNTCTEDSCKIANVCDGGVVLGSLCLRAHEQLVNWSQAEAFCAAQGGTLASDTAAGKQSALLQARSIGCPALPAASAMWVGLYRDPAVSSSFKWTTGEPLLFFISWASGEPNPAPGYDFGAAKSDGKWQTLQASDSLGCFVCQTAAAKAQTCEHVVAECPAPSGCDRFECVNGQGCQPMPLCAGDGVCTSGVCKTSGTCPGGGVLREGRCYRGFQVSGSWLAANDHCAFMGMTLAAASSPTRESAIQGAMIAACHMPDDVHIGLEKASINQGYAWRNGDPFTYTNWGTNFPSSNLSMRGAIKSAGGKWHDVSQTYVANCLVCEAQAPIELACTTTHTDCNDDDQCTSDSCDPATGCVHSLVCDDNDVCTNDACLAGPLPCVGGIQYGQRCYRAFNQATTWPAAAAACGGAGGMLAAASTPERNDAIRTIATQSCGSSARVHIGLADEQQEGSFVWLNGDPLAFTNWASGEPNDSGGDDFVEMNPSGAWNDIAGQWVNPCYVCEFVTTATCYHAPVSCDDGDVCTEDSCTNPKGCTADVRCDDGDLCTIDSCSPSQDGPCCAAGPAGCIQSPGCADCVCALMPQCCEDVWSAGCAALAAGFCGSACQCASPGYECTHEPISCDDGEPCTNDYCDSSGECVTSPTVCTDAGLCELPICEFGVGCTTVPTDCHDGNPCTADACATQNECEGGIIVGGRCYTAHMETATWKTAATRCEQRGGVLAAASSSARNNSISSLLTQFCWNQHAWIGLTDEAQEGVFEWVNGDSLSYTNWTPGEPNNLGGEDYVMMFGGGPNVGRWNDAPGSTQLPCFVCERQLPALGACFHTPVQCDDGDACTQDSCHPQLGCQSTAPCATDDSCEVGKCSYTGLGPCCTTTGAPGCAADAQCASCVCQIEPICCTSAWTDFCRQLANTQCAETCGCTGKEQICVFAASACDDGDPCTNDHCDTGGQCTHSPSFCDDGDPCTADSCSVQYGCPGGVELEGRCYRATAGTTTWLQAASTCELSGGHLPVASTDERNAAIRSAVQLQCGVNAAVPIGLSDEETEGVFVWANGDPVVYTNWAPGQPDNLGNQDYVAQSGSGLWNDNGAGLQYTCRVCESPLLAAAECANIPMDCHDDDACTVDACAPLPGGPAPDGSAAGCVHSPLDCEDNNVCTTDSCDSEVGCIHAQKDCDDQNLCTHDSCVAAHVCPGGTIEGGRCYRASLGYGTWQWASSQCAAQGGTLAAASTAARNMAARNAANAACGSTLAAWFGLFDPLGNGPFVWQNGDELAFTNWASGAPGVPGGPRYGSLNPPGTWTVGNLTANRQCYICEFELPPLGQCVHSAVDCSGGEPCGANLCHPEIGCLEAPLCHDQNPCTHDMCADVPPSICCLQTGSPGCPDSTTCSSCVCAQSPSCCTSGWTSSCRSLALGICADACNCGGTAKLCLNSPGGCEDGDPCTLNACQGGNECISLPYACDDADPCTTGQCGPVPFCANGVLEGERCYEGRLSSGTWSQAATKCTNEGATLAAASTEGRNAAILAAAKLSCAATHSIWIGLNDIQIEGQFVWTNGDPFDYTNWAQGEPNNSNNSDVVQMLPTGLWNDNTVATSLPCYVCERPAGVGPGCNYAPIPCDDEDECTQDICEPGPASLCCTEIGSPGCADSAACEICVCEADASCCLLGWDAPCISAATGQCSQACGCDSGLATCTHAPLPECAP